MPLEETGGVGTTFGPWDDKFRITKLLGKGSQGEVYICNRILHRDKEYAVKRIDVGTLEMRHKRVKVRVNLKREIEIMRELTHVRIVNLLEAYWDSDVCFIVMEYAKGGSLHAKLCPDVGLEGGEQACRHVTKQLLEGIAYMHANCVVHRDLKPENILIAETRIAAGAGHPVHDIKIADFGLSRCLKEVGGASHNMTACGTPAFAAPEVVLGDYDERADFWSFGCILFVMLCGVYPFDEIPDHLRNPSKYKEGKLSPELTPCESWETAPHLAKSLVLGLLRVQVVDRFRLDDCLGHPWLGQNRRSPGVQACDSPVTSPRQSEHSTRNPCQSPRLGGAKLLDGGRVGVVGSRHWQCFQWPPPWFRARDVNSLLLKAIGVVSKIDGWSGTVVDSLVITMRRGSEQRSYTTTGGGTKHSSWSLAPNECIIAVRQEISYRLLGAALVFYTSKCQIIAHQGTDAVKRRRFVAPAGTQVVGLQFESNWLSGILMEKFGQSNTGAVEKITGSVGYAVDNVALHMRNGTTTSYGRQGGSIFESFTVEKNEYIVIVEQGRRDGYIASSLSFYMSSGRVISLRGMAASRSVRFMAPAGTQICGLEFQNLQDPNGKQFRQLESVSFCPFDGNLALATTQKVTEPVQ